MDLGLASSVTVVTGGASGIGRAIVEQFAREGACVAIWDVSDAAAQAASEIESATGKPVIALRVDITSSENLQAAHAQTVSSLGPVDHLIHAAAIGSGKFGFPFTNLTPEDWLRVLDVNIMGMTRVAHTVAPSMVEQKSGTMTFIASVAGQIGSPTDPPYSASKAANINFAQCMARDLSSSGVRVNTVCPGMVQTPLNRSVWQAWDDRQADDQKKDYEAWAGEKIRQLIPLGTWQEPSDIADMVTFLASKRARQVTGQTINVDGGFVMHW
ncbi:MAG: SDR family NAD(P)-dependent oxidoreductase [Planctomycetota bacterium]|nr:SDR family NAD(P)-dependent oxidoreductase [Planctomycetota bacterium]